MTKLLLATVLIVITFALTRSASTQMKDAMPKEAMTTTTTANQDSSIDSTDIDVIAVMNACNESFRIEMSYIQAMNESGSFLDETDKTPKCFIRCVFTNVGIVSEDGKQFNPARAAFIFAGERNGKPMDDIGDMTAACAADRQETCPCERSYQFLRCLMSMEIEKYEKS
uniref:Odorant-binding protein 6 n=1 Tax=Mythimna separata TaxID=271217 RepID=A0A5H2N7I6_MYTSE|nr:odorant-binding protein 6 [Mythimna separata]